jgi:hypothetical protein
MATYNGSNMSHKPLYLFTTHCLTMGVKVHVTTWAIAQVIQMALQIACGEIDSSKKS